MKVLPAAVAVPSSHAAAASGHVSKANVDFKTSAPCAPGVLKFLIEYIILYIGINISRVK